jgi:hypothetical protein
VFVTEGIGGASAAKDRSRSSAPETECKIMTSLRLLPTPWTA